MSRSSLVFLAKEYVPNRFELVKMVVKATRALHQGVRTRNVRLADTINEAFVRVAAARQFSGGESSTQR